MDHRKIRDKVFKVGRQNSGYHSKSRWLRVITSKTLIGQLTGAKYQGNHYSGHDGLSEVQTEKRTIYSEQHSQQILVICSLSLK